MKPHNNRHNIKSLLFDIVFDDERRAKELYDDIRQLHYQELEQVICSCLDQFVGTGAFARLDEVELDLGAIHYRDLNAQFAQRVYDSLTEKLKELLKGSDKKEDLQVSNSFTNIELIKHYLLEGYLPWNTKENVANLITISLQEEREAISLMLREIGRSSKVRQRLVSRFDSSVIIKIIQTLSPNNNRLILQFHRQLVQRITQDNIVNVEKSKLEKEVWLFVFNFLLLNPTKDVQTSRLIKDTLIQFSEKYQYSFSKLLFLLSQDFKQSKGVDTSILKNIFTRISKGLNIGLLQEANLDKKYIHLTSSERTKVLIHFLFNNTLVSDVGNIRLFHLQQHLMELLVSEPNTIIDLLKDARKASILVRHLIRIFSLKPIHALVRHIEPGSYRTVIDYHKSIINIHQKEPILSATGKSFSDSLWEMIIGLLVNQSGSYFNQLTFLKDVIGQLANHYNIDYLELLEQLNKTAIQVSIKSSLTPVFIKMLSEIYIEDKQSKQEQISQKAIFSQKHLITEKTNELLLRKNEGDTFYKKQNNRKAIHQYFLNKDTTNSLSLIRQLLLEAIDSEPQGILSILKKQSNYFVIIERLVHDFDEVVLQELVKIIEPINYQPIFDYQKNILLAQKKDQTIQTSSSELSDVLWNIILKILLSRSSSRFNQKSFLKKLLTQTSAHYNVKYNTLIDQLCSSLSTNSISHSESSNYHSFSQLILEIQLEEQVKSLKKENEAIQKNKKNKIEKKEKLQTLDLSLAVKDFRIPESLLEIILKSPAEAIPKLIERGFASMEEAVRHLILYQNDLLVKTLKITSAPILRIFIAQLSNEAVEGLINSSNTGISNQVQKFLMNLNRKLYQFGFQQRESLMKKMTAQCLYFLVKEGTGYPEKLLQGLEKIIVQFKIPDAFFDKKEPWRIPIDGNLDDNIRGLEERFNRELEGQILAKSKAILMLEELLNSSNQKEIHLPYSKKEEIKIEKEIYISNAGLVIFNGYLHFFFQQCGYLEETGILRPDMAKRAALLLQYVFDPEGMYGEEEMVLNKLLCGLSVNEILPDDFIANEVEKNTSHQMLDAIISHWKMVSNSSHEGFRESWLQREGKLTKKEKHWHLLVEQRSFDIMLDYKPFTLSPVKFRWMKKAIKVEWR